MKLCFTSDLHMQYEDLFLLLEKNIDYLFITGDLTNFGTIPELEKINKFFKRLKQEGIVNKEIIIIAGNHDQELDIHKHLGFKLFTNCIYLEESGYTLENGYNVYGTPYVKRYADWGFMREKSDLNRHWDKIPLNTDILLTHQPPLNILDSFKKEHFGCELLYEKIQRLINLKIHAFGHIHASYGHKTINNIHYINSALIKNSKIFPIELNDPIIIDI